MKTKYLFACAIVAMLTACQAPLTEEDVFAKEENLEQMLKDANPEGYKLYTLHEFLDTYMTEKGNYKSDSTLYRTRAITGEGHYLFSIDTLPSVGKGIYIRGRISTDDFGGNFYKSLVIQQIVDGKQQNLRISVDLGSAGGMYQIGQEILIRCNGLAVGRYANQPQLCIPSYNNNIFANNQTEKIGWAPGRISSTLFRSNTTLVGLPDQSKLMYDTLSLQEMFIKAKDTDASMAEIRKLDARLVVVKDVWFTGEYEDNGSFTPLTTGDPEKDTNANVFAPTTTNIGYPQSRVILEQSGTHFLVSNSEYCKYSHFYLPGANRFGVQDCPNWVGTITGILGWYLDNAKYADSMDGYEWSITPRGIIGYGMDDIRMTHTESGMTWRPNEYFSAQ